MNSSQASVHSLRDHVPVQAKKFFTFVHIDHTIVLPVINFLSVHFFVNCQPLNNIGTFL
jgi:hypothetical protein